MNNALRRSEKWFNRGLWLIAFIFAAFLIGLGSRIIQDLPSVEEPLSVEQFIDQTQMAPLRESQQKIEVQVRELEYNLSDANDLLERAKQLTQTETDTFNNWIATRTATQLPSQDKELILRTKALDELKQKEHAAWQHSEQFNEQLKKLSRESVSLQTQMEALTSDGYRLLYDAQQSMELRVFFYRLALTLPLLIIAGYLFAKKRHVRYWPFVWGFIFFALFAFFVELVPYLPSYGGYVRYGVGIILTLILGRYAIVALNRYLEKQRTAEQLPESKRRDNLSYDLALGKLAKGICPGCERPVPLDNATLDYCPHCRLNLFNYCHECNARKSAFSHFCYSCGAKSTQKEREHTDNES